MISFFLVLSLLGFFVVVVVCQLINGISDLDVGCAQRGKASEFPVAARPSQSERAVRFCFAQVEMSAQQAPCVRSGCCTARVVLPRALLLGVDLFTPAWLGTRCVLPCSAAMCELSGKVLVIGLPAFLFH